MYVDIVISNVFHLNKKKTFLFHLEGAFCKGQMCLVTLHPLGISCNFYVFIWGLSHILQCRGGFYDLKCFYLGFMEESCIFIIIIII